MTSRTFKKRYANHKKSFSNPRYSSETELSKYVWELKNKKRDFNIKWSVLKRVARCAAGRKPCNLCLEEKLCITESDRTRILNRRSELFSKCCHRFKFSARNFKRTHNGKDAKKTDRLLPDENTGARFKIVHDMLWSTFLLFRFQINLESSVFVSYFSRLKDFLWL